MTPRVPELIEISPNQATLRHSFVEAWIHRDLLWWFTWRDLKVRFKQTALGAVWIVVQPLALMAVFALFLGRLASVPSDGQPYVLFAYCGLTSWTFFSQTLTATSGSILANSALITKVYFPRMLVPLGAAVGRVVDVAIAGSLLGLLLPLYGRGLTWGSLLSPLYLGIGWITALGVGSLVAAFSIRYRDAQQVMPFLVQVWLFASPVAYPMSLVPERWRTAYSLNPVSTMVEGFRSAVLGTPRPGVVLTAVSTATALLFLGVGLATLHRAQHAMTDVL